MELIPNFKTIYHKLWSVRLSVLAGVFSGLEVILPMFESMVPRGLFAALSLIAAISSAVARGVAQKEING